MTSDRLRFDFSNSGPVDLDKLKAVEDICCEQVNKGLAVYDLEVPLDKAKEVHGLRAVFGEVGLCF